MRSVVQSLLILLTVLTAAAWAGSSSKAEMRAQGLRLVLELEEPSMLQFGVLAGRVTYHNDGFSNLIIYPYFEGNLIDIEKPDGTIWTFEVGFKVPPKFRFEFEIPPGHSVSRPLCLVRSHGWYVFDRAGRHRLRFRYQLGNDLQDDATVVSGWISLLVKPAGDGLEIWRQAIGSRDVVRAFSLPNGPERWRQQLHRFLDYRHEMVKLILYQYEGPAILKVLRGTKPLGGEEEVAAEIMVAVSQAAGIGEAMWEWIQNALLNSAHRSEEPDPRVIVNGGYLF